MSKFKICLVVGARPNFMKSAPLMRELLANKDSFDTKLLHTGQHYDHALSQLFFDELKMPKPDIYLGVGSGSHAEQTGKIMIELEKSFGEMQPDLVVVFGDINSTLAAAVVTAKMCIKLAHVEAGLRSFDNTMPEEINRIVTDRLSHYLFVSEDSGIKNLKNEGVSDDKVFYTGNIMIDSLVANLEIAKKSDILDKLDLAPDTYIAMTMHRPANVDEEEKLRELFEHIIEVSAKMPIVFPCHPRTKKRLEDFGITGNAKGLKMSEPLGYLDFLKLQSNANFVLTDSGG
ncbi:MAG: UDP-N-acetylglucosamine 2-epimerase (non-hydrolyzing), partial [Calditrichaeota bacterium]